MEVTLLTTQKQIFYFYVWLSRNPYDYNSLSTTMVTKTEHLIEENAYFYKRITFAFVKMQVLNNNFATALVKLITAAMLINLELAAFKNAKYCRIHVWGIHIIQAIQNIAWYQHNKETKSEHISD